MSKFKLIGVMIMVAMAFVACENNNGPLAPEMGDTEGALGKGGKPSASVETASACNADGEFVGYNETNNPDYGIYEYTLWAGQHNDAGTVTITNDDDNIYVTYNTNSTADLAEVHVYFWTQAEKDAGIIPTKRPAPGHADYVIENINADAVTVTIPSELACGENFYISTHAALIANDTEGDEAGSGDNAGETAYAGNADSPACFDGTKGAWWGYVNYTVECYFDISGTVYEDADNSGNMEDEAGFDGITVTLVDADGNVVATTTTNPDGSYLFEHVAGGADYTVVTGTPAGDYLANENAGGYSISNLSNDVSDVDFGFVPLYDIALSVLVNADCAYDLSLTFDGVELNGIDGFYFIENQLPGQDYMLVATATSSEGSVTQSWTGSLTADLSLDFELTVDCPSDDNNGGGDDEVDNEGTCDFVGATPSGSWTQGDPTSPFLAANGFIIKHDLGMENNGQRTYTITGSSLLTSVDVYIKHGRSKNDGLFGDLISLSEGSTVDTGNHTMTWDSVMNNGDGTYTYTFTFVQYDGSGGEALSHMTWQFPC